MQYGSWGSAIEDGCTSIGSDCSSSTAAGGGLLLSIGYVWRGLGFDVFAAATGDVSSRTFQSPYGGESVNMGRLGGLLAIRGRASVEAGPMRVALAAGPGVAFRMLTGTNNFAAVSGEGTTTVQGPTGPTTVTSVVSSNQRPQLPFYQSYNALALVGDASLEWRSSPSLALALGLVVWVEKPVSPVAIGGGDMGGTVVLISGVDTTLMPYVGLHFGS